MKKTIIISSISCITGLLILLINACDTRELELVGLKVGLPDKEFEVEALSTGSDTIQITDQKNFTLEIKMPNVDGKILTNYQFTQGGGKIYLSNNLWAGAEYIFLNQIQAIRFEPDSGGINTIVFTSNNEKGRIRKDTISFYVKTFVSVPFSINATNVDPSNGVIRPDGTLEFNVQVTSSDLTNQMQYFMEYSLPNPNASISRSGGGVFNSKDFLIQGSGNNLMELSLSFHPVGENYKLPLRIFDENDESKYDTIVFSVRANEKPVVTNIYASTSRNCGGYSNTGGTCCIPQSRKYIQETTCNYSITVNFNASDPNGLGPAGTVVNYEIRINGSSTWTGSVPSNGSVSRSVPMGSYLFRQFAHGAGKCVGANTCQSIPTKINNLNFQPGTLIEIRVQDNEGLWGDYFTTTVPGVNTSIP